MYQRPFAHALLSTTSIAEEQARMSTPIEVASPNGRNVDEAETPRSAVINPYALAELVAGRPIPWKQIHDRPRLLEEILQTPYAELFDPKYGSPLYTGFKLDE